MAEDEAEKAFFQAQALGRDTVNFEVAGDQGTDSSDSDDYDPSKTVQEQYSAPLPDSKPSTLSNFPFVVGSTSTPTKPRSLSQDFSSKHNNDTFPSQTPSRTESRASPPKALSNLPVQPKSQTISGFVVEEDGDDKGDVEYEPPAVLSDVQDMASGSATIPQRSLSKSANEIVSPYHVSHQQTVTDKESPQDVPINSSNPLSHVVAAAQGGGASKLTQGESNLPSLATTQSANRSMSTTPTTSRARLPHDRVGILEDRLQVDPIGDTEAWLELINEHRSRNRIENAREVYERFFKVFPAAAEQWVAYANMESENNELYRLEQIFNKSLLSIPNVQLWSVYLDYVRRRNNLTTDTTGQARRIISSAYDFALQNIGVDKDSGNVWIDYIQFIQSSPGNIGGSGWQDQQKMDLLRKAYQKAICIPTHAVNMLWKEYDQFEMGLNKLTGRKFLQERSPAYMTARSSFTELQNITKELVRSSLPKLPPAPGFNGHVEYKKQADIWKRWIKWEKDDPLVLKDEDSTGYKSRVIYVYKQSLMALRFSPELWFEAADFCFQNGMEIEGNDFLKQGIDANPESCLLAFKRADRLETSTEAEQDPKKRGARVREPYDRVLDALYDLISKARAREAEDIARIEESFTRLDNCVETNSHSDEDEEDGGDLSRARETSRASQIEAAKRVHAVQIGLLSRTISFAWIALMRAMRRIQGKGKPGEMVGSRQIFADARKRGRITSDVYIASALLEHHCYKDPAATKIFERGAKLFPEDENFTLEYLKHLIDINDITNARAVFETAVRRLVSNPNNIPKAKPIFAFLHEHESRYGDLVQINNLEMRMRELFPEDPTLKQFAHRYSTPSFDPTAVHLILSPSQTRPKTSAVSEAVSSRQNSPAPRYPLPHNNSPKRAFPAEDFDDDLNRPRKFIRAESPLKGAVIRRPDQPKRVLQTNGGGSTGQGQLKSQLPPPLPREIMFLLSIIPNASSYDASKFSPDKMVNMIRQIDIPPTVAQLPPLPQGGIGQTQPTVRPQYMSAYRPGS